MTTRQIPTQDEVLGYFDSLSNWGRWGDDDMLGTLNLITPEKRVAASNLVQEGLAVTCARPIIPALAGDLTSIPPLHYMMGTGESAPEQGPHAASDFLGIAPHGLTITHLDTPSHQFWNGKMYNGRAASLVTAQDKATVGGVDTVKNGIVTRGVLLDVAGVKGKEWLEAGEGVFPEDLEAAEAAQGVRLGEGDALLLRMGWYKRRLNLGAPPPPARPGLHVAAMPWLRERGVSLLVSDASHDVMPNDYPDIIMPVHRVGIVGMGLWLLDAANFEEILPVCQRLNRWEFMFTVAALRWTNATGCPVNPLAIF